VNATQRHGNAKGFRALGTGRRRAARFFFSWWRTFASLGTAVIRPRSMPQREFKL
jgi:hypothetical protein